MNATVEQNLISKIKTLSPQQVAEVEDFVEFLAAKSKKRAAIDRLLAIVPALEAAGVQPMSENEIAAEVKAARAERHVREAGSASSCPETPICFPWSAIRASRSSRQPRPPSPSGYGRN